MTVNTEDARLVVQLHAALDRASDLAIQLDVLTKEVREAARIVAGALVAVMDRAEANAEAAQEGRKA